jgi:hypothetical protein
MEALAESVRLREPLLETCFGFMDGLDLDVLSPGNPVLQNAHYNGYTGATNVSNLFVFDARGEIIWATVNGFGSTHDSTLAQELDAKVDSGERFIPDNFFVCADAAFSARLRWIRKPLRQSTRHPSVEQLNMSAAVTSARQAAEWGMGAFTRVFNRLRLPLTFDAKRRLTILKLCVNMHNYRARKMMPNQIRTVFQEDQNGPSFPRPNVAPYVSDMLL